MFNGYASRQYAPTSVRKVMQHACKQAGITRRVYPHMLRHSRATHLMECGNDIAVLQKLLGHKHIKTTMIYAHITPAFLNNLKQPNIQIQ